MLKLEVNGKIYKVEIASTDEEKEKGLSGVENLPEDEGMLFIYDEPQQVNYWMKGCSIPLDLVFIDEYGEVISVKDGHPNDETPIREKEVMYVLEVNSKSGIESGDEVDLSELDDNELDEEEEDSSPSKMIIIDEKGRSQMELDGGERIFSRIHTRKLASLAKKAWKSKADKDYKALGRRVFAYIQKQNTQEQQTVTI